MEVAVDGARTHVATHSYVVPRIAAPPRLPMRRRRRRSTSTTTRPPATTRRRRRASRSRRGCRTSASTRFRSARRSSARSCSSTRASTWPTRSTTPRQRARLRKPRGSTRSRDGLLGPRARARPEHQRDDDAGGRAEGARAGAEGAVAQGARRRRASAPTSTPWPPLHRQAGRSRHGQPRVRRRDAQRRGGVSRRPRCAHDVRRVADEPAAVELLDARRRAVRRDARSRRVARRGAAAQSESSRARCTCGFTCGSRPTRRSGPKPKPIGCCR